MKSLVLGGEGGGATSEVCNDFLCFGCVEAEVSVVAPSDCSAYLAPAN